MFKLTNKTTKDEMKGILNANITKVKKSDKTLADQIMYAGKHADKATKKDLFDLVKQTIEVLGDKLVVPAMAEEPEQTPITLVPQEAPVEKSKKSKKLAKVESEQALKPKAKKSEEVAEPKKSAKKSAKKTEGVINLDTTKSNKELQMAKQFPETISVGDDTYKVALDIKNLEDLYKALEAEEEIVVAFYWTKRHLKQFPYFNGWLGQPKSFDNDLDLANVIYVSDEYKVAYSVSLYTEGVYTLLAEDLEIIEGLRFSAGIEFHLYRKEA